MMAASAAFRAAGSCWGDAGWTAPAEQHICDNMSKGEIDASEAASRAQHSLPPSNVELSDLAHLVPAATLSALHGFQRALILLVRARALESCAGLRVCKDSSSGFVQARGVDKTVQRDATITRRERAACSEAGAGRGKGCCSSNSCCLLLKDPRGPPSRRFVGSLN